HLLARDDPLVAVALRPRRQGCQIGAGTWLREELAPHLLVANDWWKEAEALLLAAVGEERGRGKVEPKGIEAPEVVPTELTLDGARDLRRHVEAAVLDG